MKYLEQRIKILFFCYAGLFALVALRLFQIQVINGERFKKMAESQFPCFRIFQPQRGNIYDCRGKLIASSLNEKERIVPREEGWESLLGFLNWEGRGASGLEYYWDSVLQGETEKIKWITDSVGRPIIRKSHMEVLKSEGNSLFLSIDRAVQYKSYQVLKKQVEQYGANWGMVLIGEVATGQLRAAVYYDKARKNRFLSNPVVGQFIEPGSTFKIVTAAAALEEKLVRPGDRFWCEEGLYQLGDFPVRDHEKYGWLTFQGIIENSSNIGTAKISEIVGKEKLYFYAKRFGFGNYTGVKIPGETKGILRKVSSWSGTSLARISFGQEVGATGMQLLQLFSVVANGGILLEPQIAGKITSAEGETLHVFGPEKIRRVVSPETARILADFMEGAVTRGTGRKAEIPGYRVAGKTGTSQKYDPELKSYSWEKFVSSFCGFFPADKPLYTIAVIIDEPDKIYYGGEVAAPVFKEIAGFLISQYSIPPAPPAEKKGLQL